MHQHCPESHAVRCRGEVARRSAAQQRHRRHGARRACAFTLMRSYRVCSFEAAVCPVVQRS